MTHTSFSLLISLGFAARKKHMNMNVNVKVNVNMNSFDLFCVFVSLIFMLIECTHKQHHHQQQTTAARVCKSCVLLSPLCSFSCVRQRCCANVISSERMFAVCACVFFVFVSLFTFTQKSQALRLQLPNLFTQLFFFLFSCAIRTYLHHVDVLPGLCAVCSCHLISKIYK